MLWRNKSGKNRNDEGPENKLNENHIETETQKKNEGASAEQMEGTAISHEEVYGEKEPEMTKEELIRQNEDARKVFESIKELRKSVETIKVENIDEEIKIPSAGQVKLEESPEIIAAKQAIFQRAKEDSEGEKKKQEEKRQRKLKIKQEEQRVREAQERAAKISEEAERKRLEALEAEKTAKEVARKKALEFMEAERRANEDDLLRNQHSATPEEMNAFFGKETANKMMAKNRSEETKQEEKDDIPEDLNKLKEKLLSEQEKQEKLLGHISKVAGKKTDEIAEVQKNKVEEVAESNRRAKEELELRLQVQQLKAEQEKARAEEVIRLKKAEAAAKAKKLKKEEAIRAEKIARAEAIKAAKLAKAEAARAEKLAKAEAELARKRAKKQFHMELKKKKHADKLQRAEEKERIKQEKKRLARERELLEAQRKAEAEMGGGIVNVKGVQIKTEINKKPSFRWRDFFGLISRKDKKAAITDEEKKALEEEMEIKREQAREAAVILSKQRRKVYENSRFGKVMDKIKTYCDVHKKGLLTTFAIVIMAVVCTMGVINYYTAYEYSYNGRALGIVKSKDDVLKIIDLVQGALTEEKNMDVVIDAKEDITFERFIYTPGNTHIHIDDSEEVLRRLTYMGDLNVEAEGIYVNGRKVGAVQDRKTAGKVLEEVKNRYAGVMEGAEIKDAVFIEKVRVRKSNTSLRDLKTQEEMVDTLCNSGVEKKIHKVIAGDTLNSVAKLYDVSEEQIMKDNDKVNSKKLEVGSTIVINQKAPLLTVKITEVVTYDKIVEHEVEKKKDGDIYEGYTETAQKGADGVNEVTSKITTSNGKIIEEENITTTVKKEPVKEVILVGTKKRPPTVGSGKYIWPLKVKFHQTTGFESRWGDFHHAIDLACNSGSDIYAADGGTVIQAGYMGSYGNVIFIDHKNGQETRYAHCSKLLVKKGDKVFQGQVIAKVGSTGRSTGPHLHFEVRINGVPKNPHNYLP